MPTLRTALRVEGNSDRDFYSEFIPRMIADTVSDELTIPPPIVIAQRERNDETICSVIKNARASFDLLCIHADIDSARREGAVEEWVAQICRQSALHACLPCELCVPLMPFRATEAWILADQRALAEIFGVRQLPEEFLPALADPERIPNPKSTLQTIAKAIRGRRRQGTPLPFGRIGREIELEALRCLQSFRSFETRFVAALVALGFRTRR